MADGPVLTLATLVLNADGTVTAMNEAGQAVSLNEKKITSSVKNMERSAASSFGQIGLSAKRLTDGLVNMRRLISGLFLGFSVGGAVFALANLVTETVTATSWFQKLKENVVDLTRAIFLLEDATERYARKSAEMFKASGIRTVEAIQADITQVTKTIIQEQMRLAEGTSEVIKVITAQGEVYVEAASINISLAFKKLKLLQDELRNILGPAKAVKPAGVPELTGDPSLLQLGGPSSFLARGPGAFEQFGAQFEAISAGMSGFQEELQSGLITWDTFESKVSRSIDILKEYGFTLEQISQVPAVQFRDAQREVIASAESMMQTYSDLINVIGIAGGVFQAAADSGILSQKRMFQVTQALIAAEATIRGMFELAAAAASAAMYDFGAAALHKLSAGLYFATAAFRVAGAVTGGGGSRGGGGRGFGGGASSAVTDREPQRSGQDIHIVIDGLTLVPLDIKYEAQVGRRLGEIIGSAMRDTMGPR